MTEPAPTSRILVVDDLPVNLDLLVNCLADDYRVFAAPNGAAALAILREQPIDIVLLDIIMPEMNGYEVCRRIKADPATADIPVIFVSALSELENEAEGFQVGAVDYLLKPVRPPIVQARVATHLALHRARQQLEIYSRGLEAEVAQRTLALDQKSRALAAANQRLESLDRLKWDFLRMINHEFRTPLNGLIGTADLLFCMVPDSTEKNEFVGLHQQSQERIIDLLEDIEKLYALSTEAGHEGKSRARLVDVIKLAIEDVGRRPLPEVNGLPRIGGVELEIAADLLTQSLTSLLRLADCFTQASQPIRLDCELRGGWALLSFALDNFSHTPAECDTFFEIASNIRGQSNASQLALAPVVAERTIAGLLGGEVKLTARDNNRGCLDVRLPTGPR